MLFLCCSCILASQGCASSGDTPVVSRGTVPPSARIPDSIQRLAVVYPRVVPKSLSEAYHQLESAAFQLKAQRSGLQIVDRIDLPQLRDELILQSSGLISDRTAAPPGRMLGVDGILQYYISYPSTYELEHSYETDLMASPSVPKVLGFLTVSFFVPPLAIPAWLVMQSIPEGGSVPELSEASYPVMVSSKIILVETGEVVFHNVVTARIREVPDAEEGWEVLIQSALEQSVHQTVTDLQEAFQEPSSDGLIMSGSSPCPRCVHARELSPTGG